MMRQRWLRYCGLADNGPINKYLCELIYMA